MVWQCVDVAGASAFCGSGLTPRRACIYAQVRSTQSFNATAELTESLYDTFATSCPGDASFQHDISKSWFCDGRVSCDHNSECVTKRLCFDQCLLCNDTIACADLAADGIIADGGDENCTNLPSGLSGIAIVGIIFAAIVVVAACAGACTFTYKRETARSKRYNLI